MMEELNTNNEVEASKEATQQDNKQENKKTEKKGNGMKEAFKEFRGEFKKIIWPSRKELFKDTVTVVVTSLCFGILIFLMDTVYNAGYTAFINVFIK